MPSRKYTVMRTALLNHSKNWPLCFHNKDVDDGKKSNDLISLQPKWNKKSCHWLSRFSRGHLVLKPTLFLQLYEKLQLTHFEIKRNHPRELKGLKRLAAKAKSLPMDAQMKSSCELLFAQAKLPLQSKADNLGLFQVHINLHPGWIPSPQAKPCSFSFLLRAEGLFLNSILLELLTAFLGVALKNCVCAL